MNALAICAFAMVFVPYLQERPVQNEDARLKAMNEEIAMTTPEGKDIIERVKRMLPEVNGRVSKLPPEELVEKYVKEKNVTPVGWSAFKPLELVSTNMLRSGDRWQIRLFYQMDTKEYRTAEWRYDSETVTLRPFDEGNAAQFWAGPSPRE
jgi:hypothetical protein